jgi:uncharacterized protein YjiS (DUF1127 family)
VSILMQENTMSFSVTRRAPFELPRRFRLSLAPWLARWRQRQWHAACVASLRQLPQHTLRDIGLADCVPEHRRRLDLEAGRWF